MSGMEDTQQRWLWLLAWCLKRSREVVPRFSRAKGYGPKEECRVGSDHRHWYARHWSFSKVVIPSLGLRLRCHPDTSDC